MSRHLLLFTVAPAQAFIKQARKAQDLFAGSALLSRMAYEGMKWVQEDPRNGQIVYPIIGDELDSYPNVFLTKIETDKPDEIGKGVEKQVREYFKGLAGSLPKAEKFNLQEDFNKLVTRQAEAFLRSALNIYWVAAPYDEEGYKRTYKSLTARMEGVKSLRQFSFPEESGRKCSLDGTFNAAFYRLGEEESGLPNKLFQEKGKVAVIETDDQSLLSFKDLEPGEGLSVPSMVKRRYRAVKGFESTAKIVAMRTLEELEEKEFTNFKGKVEQGFDEQLLYEENLNAKYFKQHGVKLAKGENLSTARTALRELERLAKSKRLRFGKYYALLLFDADNMGKFLSGEYVNDDTSLEKYHQARAQCLKAFAKEAREFVNAGRGRVIYAGGDDFLGFVNLDFLYDTMIGLRALFHEHVSEKLKGLHKKGHEASTFSAGVVIAHYKSPLHAVLDRARDAESVAKGKGRNAFAISSVKHSGEVQTAAFQWGSEASSSEDCSRLIAMQCITTLLFEERFSNSFIGNLDRTVRQLLGLDKKGEDGFDGVKDMLKTEAKRLLQRSHKEEKEALSGNMQALLPQITRLLEASETPSDFVFALHIADFLARERNELKPLPEPAQP